MKLLVREVIDETLAALKAAGTLSFEAVSSYNIEVPKNLEHGDWSCNVAMVMSRAAGKKPADLADAIIKGLVDRKSIVTSVEKAGPGFLNFRLRDAVFQAVAREVLEAGLTFGRSKQKSSGKKMQVEFVSANPTGPVHIGHARGAFMGDAVSRLLEAAGHDVTREFYINDAGNQVETLGRTVFKRYQQLFGATVELAEGEYPAEYVIEIAKTWKNEVGETFLNKPQAQWLPAAIAVGIRDRCTASFLVLDKIIHTNSLQLCKCTKLVCILLITCNTFGAIRYQLIFSDINQLAISTFLKHPWTILIWDLNRHTIFIVLCCLLQLDNVLLITFKRGVNLKDAFEVIIINLFCFLLRELFVPSFSCSFIYDAINSELFIGITAVFEVGLLNLSVAKNHVINSTHLVLPLA